MSRRYGSSGDRYTPLDWTVLWVGTAMVVILFVFGLSYLGTKVFRQPTEYDACLVNGGSFTQNEHGMSCIED